MIRLTPLLLVASVGTVSAADVPSPESHLGFRPGADFRLAPWGPVVDYFRKVDAASDRVVVRELGKSTEGRPYLVAIVSDEATIKDLDRHKALQRAIALPGSGPTSAGDPVKDGKAVVLVTCSIHSTETASTHMAMELLHGLATGDDPATREILANTILLLVPSANPDGVDKVAAWYERSKGKPWEGEGLPELYHKYAGHDTNRDWFMLNLQETKLLTRLLYHEWFPNLAYDVHQMGSKGARMFVPPFFDPTNPNLDPRISQGIALVGSHMAADLATAGKSGVLTNAMYDNWWNGGMRTTPQRHNIVAVLTESASVKLASPLFLDKADLRGVTRGFTSHEPAVNFVEPWPGGWWRLRDIVDYQLICARSILTLAGRYKEQFRSNQLRLGLESIREGREEPPYGWVVPMDRRDPGTAAKMVGILRESGIEVRRARSPFVADGVTYAAGTWLLPADQAFRPHLKDLMERQEYPNRLSANGAAEPPYDVAGWTLPLQMGVSAVALGTPYSGDFEVVDKVESPKGGLNGSEKPEFFSIANRSNDDFRVLNALLAAGVEPSRVRMPLMSGSEELPSGTILFKADEKARAVLDRVLPGVSTRVEGRVGLTSSDLKSGAPAPIRKPRVAVYQPWTPSMDEGWTRLVLERFDFPHATIHDADVRAGKLHQRFDVVVLASIPARALRDGYKPGESEPAYVGGLGAGGVEALRGFVEAGGNLVCLEDSCNFAIEEFRLPVRNVLKELKSSEFYAPGSILRCRVEPDGFDHLGGFHSSPLTAGMPAEISVYFDRSLAFELDEKAKTADSRVAYGTVLASYAPANTLESGWLLGPEKVQGKAALVDVKFGSGRVVLFGFPPQHRGQPHGTFRLLFNALSMSEE